MERSVEKCTNSRFGSFCNPCAGRMVRGRGKKLEREEKGEAAGGVKGEERGERVRVRGLADYSQQNLVTIPIYI